MNITDVRIRLVEKESKVKAVASITIDDSFVVHDIKIIDGKDGYFIVMPSKTTRFGEYRDVAHPIKSEVRAYIRDMILEAFEKEKIKPDVE